MSNSFNITIKDNTGAVMAEFEKRVELALKAVGSQAEAYAKLSVTDAQRDGIDLTRYGEYDNSRVDRGQLRNSITHVVKDGAVYIGSDTPYAPYHELGTGIYASQPGGRQSPWVYYNRKLGTYMQTKGLYPLHFLKNAASMHLEEYARIINEILAKGQ